MYMNQEWRYDTRVYTNTNNMHKTNNKKILIITTNVKMYMIHSQSKYWKRNLSCQTTPVNSHCLKINVYVKFVVIMKICTGYMAKYFTNVQLAENIKIFFSHLNIIWFLNILYPKYKNMCIINCNVVKNLMSMMALTQ